MKGIHWSIWIALFALCLVIVTLARTTEGYAPPRDQNTQPPFTEDTSNQYMTSNNTPYIESTGNTVTQNQTQIYKDMGGLDFQIQAGNPILNFIQGDPSSNVIIGDFVPNESDGGSAQMYPIVDVDMTQLPPVPSIKTANVLSTSSLVNQGDPSSNVIIGDFVPNESDGRSAQMYPIVDVNMTQLPPVPSTSSLVNQADKTLMGPNAISEVTGHVITPPMTNGPTAISETGQYIPELTSPSIPFLGTT